MVPSHFVPLRDMPLTPNGKVDRRALPAPDATRATSPERRVAPRGDVEAMIHEVFVELLGHREFGVLDDFFRLGGNSMMAARLMVALRGRGIVLQLRDLFEGPTVAELAAKAGRPSAQTARSWTVVPLSRESYRVRGQGR
jgi:hypothetical protein